MLPTHIVHSINRGSLMVQQPRRKKREPSKPIMQDAPLSVFRQIRDFDERINTFSCQIVNISVLKERGATPRVHPEHNVFTGAKVPTRVRKDSIELRLRASPYGRENVITDASIRPEHSLL